MKAGRAIMFDFDDVDASLTELDLLHAETAAENELPIARWPAGHEVQIGSAPRMIALHRT
jgi:hypothetical protein